MERDYKIEVCVTPSLEDDPAYPYFWVLFAHRGQWSNEGAGWAETPEKAWNEAYTYYQQVIRQA